MSDDQRQTFTLDADGKLLTAEQDGISMPADHTFACVNDYVHDTGRHFEELQCLALGMACEIDQLRAEVEALRKDAERYRWLRRQPNDCSAPRIDICHWQHNGDDSVNEGEGLRLEAADEAIDAAMAAKEGM